MMCQSQGGHAIQLKVAMGGNNCPSAGFRVAIDHGAKTAGGGLVNRGERFIKAPKAFAMPAIGETALADRQPNQAASPPLPFGKPPRFAVHERRDSKIVKGLFHLGIADRQIVALRPKLHIFQSG